MAKKKLRYFYLDGRLHKVLQTNRAQDLMVAWDYPNKRVATYLLSDVKRKHQRAFTITELAEMLGRHRDRIVEALHEGKIEYPQRVYTLDGRANPGKWMFSEEDAMDVHSYFASVHIGRPRKDGRITNNRLPNRQEFRTLVKSGRMLYTKQDDKFVPVFVSEDF